MSEDKMKQDLPWTARQDDKIRSAIFVSLGEASMCWDRTPQGVFDSELATIVGNQLYSDIIRILFTNELRGSVESDTNGGEVS